MFQNLLTYLLVIVAVSYTFYKFYKTIFPKKIKTASHSCGGCTGCELKDKISSAGCNNFKSN